MGREVRRKARTARLQWHAPLKSGVWLRGVVLTCSLLLVSVLNGWSDVPPKEGGHHRHRLVAPPPEFMPQKSPVRPQPRLAIPPRCDLPYRPEIITPGGKSSPTLNASSAMRLLVRTFPQPKPNRGMWGLPSRGWGRCTPRSISPRR